jgi:hypothetical protein
MPEDSNHIIELYKASDNDLPEDLLLNEIGPQHGSTRRYNSGTFYLDVTGAEPEATACPRRAQSARSSQTRSRSGMPSTRICTG